MNEPKPISSNSVVKTLTDYGFSVAYESHLNTSMKKQWRDHYGRIRGIVVTIPKLEEIPSEVLDSISKKSRLSRHLFD